MSGRQHILVSGGNKGIGKEIIRQLSHKYPGATIFMGTRDINNGNIAIKEIIDTSINRPIAKIVPLLLDITSQDDVDNAMCYIREHYGFLHTLYCNAAVYLAPNSGLDCCTKTMSVNYYGTKRLINAAMPLMPRDKTGRIIIVSSIIGAWVHEVASPLLRTQIDHPETLSVSDLDLIVQEYLKYEEVRDEIKINHSGQLSTKYTCSKRVGGNYGFSKSMINIYGRILARELRNEGIIVVITCPGFCKTQLTNNKGVRKASSGARSILFAENIPFDYSGIFIQDNIELPFALPMLPFREYKRLQKASEKELDSFKL